MKWAGHVVRMGDTTHKIIWLQNLNGRDNSEDLGEWKYNIRMDLTEIEWEVVEWIRLTQYTD
jgi:hypothetical protein